MGSPSSFLSADAASFLAIQTRSELAAWLGLGDRQLRYILYRLGDTAKYSVFSIRKRNGGVRQIHAPTEYMKSLQRKLHGVIAEISPSTGIAKGYVRNRSVVDHAHVHKSAKWVVLADLKDFFPSINFGRVRGAFLSKPFEFPADVATCLAQLCCRDGALPQGAPTSPVISNLICRSLDHELIRLTRRSRCRVSRYADDICISTNLDSIPYGIANLIGGEYSPGVELIRVITRAGFALNPNKFKVVDRRSRQQVTGLVVNDGISIPRRWRRQVRVALHLMDKRGADETDKILRSWRSLSFFRQNFSPVEAVLIGKINYAGWIDQVCGRGFVDSIRRSYPNLAGLMPKKRKKIKIRLMAEGETDLIHLSVALKWFQSKGRFTELSIRFKNYLGDTGDADLLETISRIAKYDVPDITVGVFDRDNVSFLKKKGIDLGAETKLGDKVFVMCLQPPDGVSEPFCIESLYRRSEVVAYTSDERRLFFGDEFDPGTGIDKSGKYKREHPKKSAVVVSDKVERISDRYSSLLSKMHFAEMVRDGVYPFSNLDFSGFYRSFELLLSIAESVEE